MSKFGEYTELNELTHGEDSLVNNCFIAIQKLFTRNYKKVNRLFNRGHLFFQSNGEMNIVRKLDHKISRSLYGSDWFHTMVDSSTYKCILILLALYISLIFIFSFPFDNSLIYHSYI